MKHTAKQLKTSQPTTDKSQEDTAMRKLINHPMIAIFIAIIAFFGNATLAFADDTTAPIDTTSTEQTDTSTDGTTEGGNTDESTDEDPNLGTPDPDTSGDTDDGSTDIIQAQCQDPYGMKFWSSNPGPKTIEDFFTEGPGTYTITVISCDDDLAVQEGEQAILSVPGNDWTCTTTDIPDGEAAINKNGLRTIKTNCPTITIAAGTSTSIVAKHAGLGNPGSLYVTQMAAKRFETPKPKPVTLSFTAQSDCVGWTTTATADPVDATIVYTMEPTGTWNTTTSSVTITATATKDGYLPATATATASYPGDAVCKPPVPTEEPKPETPDAGFTCLSLTATDNATVTATTAAFPGATFVFSMTEYADGTFGMPLYVDGLTTFEMQFDNGTSSVLSADLNCVEVVEITHYV